LEDIKYDNSYYCNIGGISNEELNMIEYSIFTRIDFNLNLQKKEVDIIYEQIYKNLPKSRFDETSQKKLINNSINNKDSKNENTKNNIKFEDIK
jgi:hypothetical protein